MQGVLEPRPKLVMNPFGKRNSCSQWEGPSMHSRQLVFFPFKFWSGRREKDYFHFSLVPNVFPLCSFQLLNGFSSGSQYVPQVPNMFLNMSSMAPHFYALANVVLLSPILVGTYDGPTQFARACKDLGFGSQDLGFRTLTHR